MNSEPNTCDLKISQWVQMIYEFTQFIKRYTILNQALQISIFVHIKFLIVFMGYPGKFISTGRESSRFFSNQLMVVFIWNLEV